MSSTDNAVCCHAGCCAPVAPANRMSDLKRRQIQTMNLSTVAWSAYAAAVIVFSFILALFVFAFVMTLPGKVGAYDYIHAQVLETPAFGFLALPFAVLFIVAPFYAAKWTYRGILDAGLSIQKRIRRQNENERNKALLPRRLLVTNPAYAGSAPSNRLAELERSAKKMIPPRTYEVQSGYALRLVTMKEVVAWAIDTLVAGYDSPSLRILAGLESDTDQIEVGRLYSAAFRELNIPPLREELYVRFYATLVLRDLLNAKLGKKEALRRLSDLCIRLGYEKDLMDFYLLYHAKWDLETEQMQWYWKNADRSNIDSIIDEYAKRWLENHAIQESAF